MSEGTGEETRDKLETIVIENKLEEVVNENDSKIIENKIPSDEVTVTGEGDKLQHVKIEIQEESENGEETKNPLINDIESIPQILINKPLCADYESSSDTESDSDSSSDSDSDSSTVDSDSDSSSEASSDDLQEIHNALNERERSSKPDKIDLELSDLPPIENLRITVPEEECQEMGTVSSIVDTLVVVQAYKDTPPYDIDTVLFLDMGKRTLGRIFDVLGPVSEPVYTVRFNNPGEIAENNITKGEKVYCAPKTEYTSYVFVSELMRMKGSDASWKNNEEAPPEFQDFSDDEEENKFKHGEKKTGNSPRPPPCDNPTLKKGRVHHGTPNFPGRTANFRNPFALGHSRNPRFSQSSMRHPPPIPRFPMYGYPNAMPSPYPDPSQFYNAQNFHRGGGMMMQQPPFHSNYPYQYQQYPSYPMQQFAMPPVMPPPPPAPLIPNQPRHNLPQNPSRVFGSNIESPSQNG